MLSLSLTSGPARKKKDGDYKPSLIDMDIPYYIQKRLLLVIYAEGIELENFRLRTFQEQIQIPFGKEEGSLQCSFVAGANDNYWTVDFNTTGSDRHEAFQIEDDGSLVMKDGLVDTGFCDELQKVLGAIQIRPAIVHVQDKRPSESCCLYCSTQCTSAKYLALLLTIKHERESSIISSRMSILQNVLPTSMSKKPKRIIMLVHTIKIYVRVPDSVDFSPLPGNSMSRRRFGQLQVFSFEIGNRDITVDMLDEIVPICLIEAELSAQEVSNLFDILMRQKHLLDQPSHDFS